MKVKILEILEKIATAGYVSEEYPRECDIDQEIDQATDRILSVIRASLPKEEDDWSEGKTSGYNSCLMEIKALLEEK